MSDTPTPQPARQAKMIGPDGAFWPAARSAMTDAEAILSRLAEDCRAVASFDHGGFALKWDDLTFLGWRPAQVREYVQRAVGIAFRDTPDETAGVLPLPETTQGGDTAHATVTACGIIAFLWCLAQIAGMAETAAALRVLV